MPSSPTLTNPPTPRLVVIVTLVGALLGALLGAVAGPTTDLGEARSGDPALIEEVTGLVGDGAGLRTLSVVRATPRGTTYAGLGDLDGSDQAPSPETLYELGSITKVFTGMLLADAVERGEMDLDEPVATYLPELAGTSAGAATPRQLATHTSGMPQLVGGAGTILRSLLGGDVYANDTTEWVLDQSAETEISPTDTPAYSNAGTALLGHATARAAGVDSWIDLLEQRLTGPLGMTDTTIQLPGTPESTRLAEPHRASGRSTTTWTGEGYAPAGSSTRTTAADMGRFATAVLDGTAPGMAALDPVLDEDGRGQGLAWVVQDTDAGTITWHNGGTAGSRTMMAVDREAETAAVVLGNTDQSVDDIGIALASPGHEARDAGPSWGLFTGMPLLVAAVLIFSAWVGLRGATSRVAAASGAIDAAVGGLIAFVWSPWHLLPHAVAGILPGLAAATIVIALWKVPSLPVWPQKRRAVAVVSLALSLVILILIGLAALR
ncbi:MAG: serine hydrolase domain-containing protein [Mobilicoccus sp.]|nr:serine hydrolase domain-containing protein [Mobilicoccus sp.]